MFLYRLLFLFVSATAVTSPKIRLPSSRGPVIKSTSPSVNLSQDIVLETASGEVGLLSGMTSRQTMTVWTRTASINATGTTTSATVLSSTATTAKPTTTNPATTPRTTATTSAKAATNSAIASNVISRTGTPIRTSETPTTGQTVTRTNSSSRASLKTNVVSADSNETSTQLNYIVGYHRIADQKNETGSSSTKTIMVVVVIALLLVVVAVVVGIGIWKRRKDAKAEKAKEKKIKKKNPEEQALIKPQRSKTSQTPAMSKTQSTVQWNSDREIDPGHDALGYIPNHAAARK